VRKNWLGIIVVLVVVASPAKSEDDGLAPLKKADSSSATQPSLLTNLSDEIARNPTDPIPLIRRGNIYGEEKMWNEARNDYQKALTLDPQLMAPRLDLAELQLRQKQYDQARSSFAALVKDKDFGDLASYKVFLCDLLACHEAVASQELAVFDGAGENPSYYFGNVAWDVVHKDIDGARGYLRSGLRIYNRGKVNLYLCNLAELGYLPLPARKGP
jgi:Tfp pilus assembly protein PilF